MQDLVGRTLGHYRIVDTIGEGGMGEVYRPRGRRLHPDEVPCRDYRFGTTGKRICDG